MSGDQTLVLVPTYNEAGNIRSTVERLRAAVPSAQVLVIDDNSPDGTGDIADRLAARDAHVEVLHRAGKGGLGLAYLAGFDWGIRRGYDVLVQMDADGSHLPEQLPGLLGPLGDPRLGADLVLGARWVPGGSVQHWPWTRELLSRGGNQFARLALGIGVRDATSGFRAWRRAALQAIDLDDVSSQGYCFQIDLTRRALGVGLHVVEVPIRFVERVEGQSKMTHAIVREAIWRVTIWGATARLRGLSRTLARPCLRRRAH
ncbi:MAG TPA: polyprenol monophosphomannose synthase [Nocardioidaceae bacterium]|nr:polyprenol monophosphomannose synthase [Nocardioidaceae bacterium]